MITVVNINLYTSVENIMSTKIPIQLSSHEDEHTLPANPFLASMGLPLH